MRMFQLIYIVKYWIEILNREQSRQICVNINNKILNNRKMTNNQ